VNIWEQVKKYANGTRICWDWLGEGGQVVDQETAQRRTNICLHCVHNQRGSILSKAVAWSVHEGLQLKNDLELHTQGEDLLGTCEICSCENRLKIWREIDKIRAERLPTEIFPAHCYIITEP